MDKIAFISSSGRRILLNGENGFSVMERVGFYSPRDKYITFKTPYVAGERVKLIDAEVRELSIGLTINSKSHAKLKGKIRELSSVFNSINGQGQLLVWDDYGYGRRAIDVYCKEGMGLEIKPDRTTDTTQTAVISLIAHDPYWYDYDPIEYLYTPSISTGTFFPFFPLRLSPDNVSYTMTIANNGDVKAYPVWRINGPGVDPVLKNNTTGEYIGITVTLAAGEYIDIDTRIGHKSIVKNGVTNYYSCKTAGSAFWAVDPGNNIVVVSMSDTDVAVSSIHLIFRQRYGSC